MSAGAPETTTDRSVVARPMPSSVAAPSGGVTVMPTGRVSGRAISTVPSSLSTKAMSPSRMVILSGSSGTSKSSVSPRTLSTSPVRSVSADTV